MDNHNNIPMIREYVLSLRAKYDKIIERLKPQQTISTITYLTDCEVLIAELNVYAKALEIITDEVMPDSICDEYIDWQGFTATDYCNEHCEDGPAACLLHIARAKMDAEGK